MATQEQQSWFSKVFAEGKDIFNRAEKQVEDAGSAVVKKVEDAGSAVIQKAKGTVAGSGTPAKAGGNSPAGPSLNTGTKSPIGAPASVLTLGGSVGRGGKNQLDDVRAVQSALNQKTSAGLGVDGKCGPATIKAIENFQRSLGQSKPDGRIDPGKATAGALASGGGAAPAAQPARGQPQPGLPEKPQQPGSKSPLSGTQQAAFSRAGIDLDFTNIRNCPGPTAALAVAILGLELVVGDIVLIVAGPAAIEGALIKVLGAAVGLAALKTVGEIAALSAVSIALDTVIGACDVSMDCIRNHQGDFSGVKSFQDKIRVALTIVNKKLEKAKKELKGDS